MPHYGTPMIWRLDKKTAGSGALGDLGAHIIDLGRFLVGEVKSVSAMTRTFIKERPLADGSGMGKVDVDDAFVAAVEFENGAIGTLEATRFAAGRKNHWLLRDQRRKGQHSLQPGTHERAGSVLGGRAAQRDAGLPRRAGHRRLSSVLVQLVAARAHHRLGAHLRPRD